jgi:ATP-binding cassette subfamily B protein/subfamily B ATP-binding cassette protein MsbA
MPSPFRSSRLRYLQYRREARQRQGEIGPSSFGHHAGTAPRKLHKRSRSFLQLTGEFFKLLRGHRAILALILAVVACSTILGLIPIYGTKLVFDNVLGDHPLPKYIPQWLHFPSNRHQLLTYIAFGMVALAAVSELAGLFTRWQGTRITKRVQVNVRRKVFDHAVHLPLHRVYELKSGGVASILREDAGSVADLIFSLIYNPWRSLIQLCGTLFVLVMVDWRLLLGALALLPTVWLTHRTWIGRIRPLFRDIRNTRQHVDAHATEAFGGMRVVRSFSRQRYETASFTINNHLMARQEILAWWWSRGIELAWSLLIPFASAVLLYYGGNRVLSDAEKVRAGLLAPERALTLGDLTLFVVYLANLLGTIAVLASSATALQNSLAGLDRILDLLSEPREMPSRPGAIVVDPARVAGRITLRDVCFSYPDSPIANRQSQHPAPALVLQNIHLDVHPGEMVALVGPSGAGKTTLCNLIARFYEPTAGSISLDGTDLRDITIESYRHLLGIVEQDTFLFDGTVADNIAYGRRDASKDGITQAARAANAHEFIMKFPSAYDTLIGERGVKLSGGQRQRLTIARALLADPRLLILDEATSNLDTESERLIQGSLQTLMSGRTSFVIAHRLSTIAHADRIVVLEEGRIIEQGKHEDLMQASGRYREMVDLQTSPPPLPTTGMRRKHD